MQADVIDLDTLRSRQSRAGLYFALWGVATKLALALAVGIAFPLLALAGLEAGLELGGALVEALRAEGQQRLEERGAVREEAGELGLAREHAGQAERSRVVELAERGVPAAGGKEGLGLRREPLGQGGACESPSKRRRHVSSSPSTSASKCARTSVRTAVV